ncbi:hypothetical protein MUB04_15430 [Acinetobacter indicus]|uniref:hypothetical protein n=1 Tax=Acinetobacter TaxID=469 RepID=UPI0015D1B0B6|nr:MULTISPECIES: hypothetical protein [Acinetobacter]MCP0917928.1 hypothetical protein [Acinetobacter indicus]
MTNTLYPSLDQAFLGLGFGLNQAGLEKLQASGVHTNHTIRSLANEVMSTWRMRNDLCLIRFNDTSEGFGLVYESEIDSIEDAWNDYAQYWIEQADDYLSGAWWKRKHFAYSGNMPRTTQSLRGFLCFGKNRSLWDKPLLEAILDKTLTFEVYKARIEHLQKLAENHIKRHAKRFYLNQIVDTTDRSNPVFIEHV